MRWPWSRRAEHRSATEGYEGQLLGAFERSALGQTATATAAAALETACGLWSRALASATVNPEAAEIVTPAVLGQIGRSMCGAGESTWLIAVDGGAVKLLPAGFTDVYGGPDPTGWRYRVSLYGPSRTSTGIYEAAGVVHCMYAYAALRPWRGISPIGHAAASGGLLAEIESSLHDEFRERPRAGVVPLQLKSPEESDPDLLGAGGGVLFVTSGNVAQLGGMAGTAARGGSDWAVRRMNADPQPATVSLRADVEHAVLSACGVPIPLATASSDGTAMRESYRRFLASTVQPIARIVEAELTGKLEMPVSLEFADLRAADVSGRARSWRALVGREAKMPDADARRIVGFD